MKRRLGTITATVLALTMVTITAAWAQGPIDDDLLDRFLSEPAAAQMEYCGGGLCAHYTYTDNENNAGAGAADDDMGDDGLGGCYTTCRGDAAYPIEFNLAVSAITYDVDGFLGLMTPPGTDLSAIRSVVFNGAALKDYRYVTTTPGLFRAWKGHLDPSLVRNPAITWCRCICGLVPASRSILESCSCTTTYSGRRSSSRKGGPWCSWEAGWWGWQDTPPCDSAQGKPSAEGQESKGFRLAEYSKGHPSQRMALFCFG